MQAGVHAHLYSISTTTSHRDLAQWRSRGNDVLEAFAEVDASAVEGGELLVDAAQAELGVEDEAAPALEERGRAEAAGEAAERRVVTRLRAGGPWLRDGPWRGGGAGAQVLRHSGVLARADAPRACAELLESGQALKGDAGRGGPRDPLQDARHLGEGAGHLAHLLLEQLARRELLRLLELLLPYLRPRVVLELVLELFAKPG
mmetsp:Transcript_38300/g.97316  ORF Transcript_38300/g.97316 Transcript_38300/m.97316 type:complete len:203 (-) Transcript_38300:150-758(-)